MDGMEGARRGVSSEPLSRVDAVRRGASGSLGRFGECLGECVEVAEGRRRQFNLFAPGIFGVVEHEPAFIAHGADAAMKRGWRTELTMSHHVFDRQTVFTLGCARHELEDFFFERIKLRQCRQAAQRLGNLQKSKIDVGRAFHCLRTI